MDKIRVLHIGIKYWPFNASETDKESLKGIRGGGMVKYCDSLIHNFNDEIDSYIITTRLSAQPKYEENNHVKILRIHCSRLRKLRLISLNVKSIFRSRNMIRTEKIDIIHGHLLSGIIAAYFIGFLSKKPVVATPYSFYDRILKFPLNIFAIFFEKNLYRKVNKIVFESAENFERLKRIRKTDYRNAEVIHTGIELPSVSPKATKAAQKIKILFVGRIVKVKALDNLISSISLLSDDVKHNIKVDIVGEGEDLESLRQLVTGLSLHEQVMLHGYVESTVDFFQQADIFILPSHSEGLSMALLEAMSFGLACIVNNYGVPFSHEEVFEMKDNTPASIHAAINYFLTHKEKIADYGRQARKAVEQRFSVKSFSLAYETVYRSLLEK